MRDWPGPTTTAHFDFSRSVLVTETLAGAAMEAASLRNEKSMAAAAAMRLAVLDAFATSDDRANGPERLNGDAPNIEAAVSTSILERNSGLSCLSAETTAGPIWAGGAGDNSEETSARIRRRMP